MNPEYTHISMLIDRSESMREVLIPAQDAVNEFISGQKQLPLKCTFTLGTFDYMPVDYQYYFAPLDDVSPNFVLEPRGSTSLYDALHDIIDRTGATLAAMPESQRPSKVLIVIQTDGQENTSKNRDYRALADKKKKQETQFNWEFLFLGAGDDAMAEAGKLGFAPSRTISYVQSPQGYSTSFTTLGAAASSLRSTGSFDLNQSTSGSGTNLSSALNSSDEEE